MPAEERRRRALMEKRAVTDAGCWLWTGSVGANGYGQYRTDEDNLYPHRMSYEMHVGLIPDGWVLHHTCGERLCFNPDHLVPMTRADHIKHHEEVTRWA